MRHRNDVFPTARLVITTTQLAQYPLSHAEFTQANGTYRSTLKRVPQALLHRIKVGRLSREWMSYCTMRPLAEVYRG